MADPLHQQLEKLLDDLTKNRCRISFMLEAIQPDSSGRLVPLFHERQPILIRMTLALPQLLGHEYATQIPTYLHNLVRNNLIPNFVLHDPTRFRITLREVRLQPDEGNMIIHKVEKPRYPIVMTARTLAKANLADTARVIVALMQELCSFLLKKPISDDQARTALHILSKLVDMPVPIREIEYALNYRGNKSAWLADSVASILSDIRLTIDSPAVWAYVHQLWDLLYRLLDRSWKPASLSIAQSLKPMRMVSSDERIVLEKIPNYNAQHAAIDEPLFAWTTETMYPQEEGIVCVAPQTRFVWHMKGYSVLMDYRIVRDDWIWKRLLPDVYIFAVDYERSLGYYIHLAQQELVREIRARVVLFDVTLTNHSSVQLPIFLSSIITSFPAAINLDRITAGSDVRVPLKLPLCMVRPGYTEYLTLKAISSVMETTLNGTLLPERFERYMAEVMDMFIVAATAGISIGSHVELGKYQNLSLKYPQPLGLLAGANSSEFYRQVSYRAHHSWLRKAFSVRDISPWHVLAWRFFDIARFCGLRNRYARYLRLADQKAADQLFAWRTIRARGEPIPIVGDPSQLQFKKPFHYGQVLAHIPLTHYGRKLHLTLQELENDILKFNPETFALQWPILQTQLLLVLED